MSRRSEAAIRTGVASVETWSAAQASIDVFRYVDIGAVDREAKSITAVRTLAVAEAPSRARQLLRANDVLVSTVRPNLNAVALVPEDLDGAVASTGFTVLRPNPKKLNARFLFHWVRTPTFVSEMTKKATGASYPAVSDRIVLDSAMPMPSPEEQRRIADILDKADSIRRKRKEAIALTEELLRSAFLDMFGDPVTNQKGWEVMSLAEVAESIDYGVTASANAHPVGPKFLRITDIQGNRVDWQSVPHCHCDAETAARARLQVDDIVFARTGATTGKSFWIRDCPEGAVFASYLIRVRPGPRVSAAYLAEFFQSAGYWSQISSMAEGAAQPGVNASKLGALRVPVPPVARQREIGEVSTSVLRLQTRGEAAVRQGEVLFKSLVAGAFSGKLGREATC